MASCTETLPHRQVTRHVMTLHADEAYLTSAFIFVNAHAIIVIDIQILRPEA